MIKRPIQDYFFFGTAVRYLQGADSGWRIADSSEGGWYVLSNLRKLFEYMGSLNLRVSLLTDAAQRLKFLISELDDSEEDATLSEEQAKLITDSVKELRTTLEAELRSTYAYSLTPKRIDVGMLIEEPEKLLAPGTYDRIPEIARFDLSEAGRCIAFETPTAAAFHLMRSTEAVLRDFHAATVLRGRRAKMWGEIIREIRGKAVGKKHEVLLNHLDHIRAAFRNPTQHPDARYDVHEIQDLWSLSVDVINRMATHLPEKNA